MDWATVIASVITGAFGVVIILMQRAQARRTRTNHGKTIGQHVEQAAADAQEAKLSAKLLALQLEEYKAQQRREADKLQRTIKGYVDADALAHAEIRSLIIQVAQGKAVS